jgi:hypothetical protein
MRISGLMFVLLWGLISVGAASDPLRQSSSSQAAATFSNVDRFNSGSGILRPDFSSLAASDREGGDHRRFDPARGGDLTCYTIESYLMKRQSPNSDVTELAGHSNCQPASKYGVKKAQDRGGALSP